jgi:hypothetical protein
VVRWRQQVRAPIRVQRLRRPQHPEPVCPRRHDRPAVLSDVHGTRDHEHQSFPTA